MGSQKVTVHVDREFLRRAQARTRQGVTATIRHGLELVAATEAYERLRALRGKVVFSMDLKALREDRRCPPHILRSASTVAVYPLDDAARALRTDMTSAQDSADESH